jgi:biopolymer transport protein ExbB
MLDLLIQGGPVMIPIIVLSVAAIALIVDRALLFARVRERRPDLLAWALGEMSHGRAATAAEELGASRSPIAAVLREGILARSLGAEERELRMEARAQGELDRMERFLPYLSSLANIETMLGLLGTVTGMIRSFVNLRLSGIADPGVLAGGIAEALITTAAGLMIAIPCLVAWHVFTQLVDRETASVERAAGEMQLWFASRGRYASQGAAAAARAEGPRR